MKSNGFEVLGMKNDDLSMKKRGFSNKMSSKKCSGVKRFYVGITNNISGKKKIQEISTQKFDHDASIICLEKFPQGISRYFAGLYRVSYSYWDSAHFK